MNFKQFGRTANLFDENASDKSNNCYLRATGDFVNSQNFDTSGYVDINGQTTITLSGMGTGNEPAYCLYNASKERISGENYANRTSIAITVGNAKYIRFSYRKADVDTTMLNTGSTVLPYQPYKDWHDVPYYIHNTSTDTITTLPADVYADGNNATVGLVGNMVQSGSPSPSSPIQPQECGERTGNLFDKDNATTYDCYVSSNGQWATGAGNKTVRILCSSNTQYTLSTASTYSAFRIMETDSDNIPSDGSPVNGTLIYYGSGNSYTFTTSNTAKYIIFQANAASLSQWLSELMLNSGSTSLPYEPYGYKIPILSGGVTTPVYLGEVQSTRQIKKLVLNGDNTENWQQATGNAPFLLYLDNMLETASGTSLNWLSNQYMAVTPSSSWSDYDYCITSTASRQYLRFRDVRYNDLADFKAYLAAQYSAGTPVTVWYVLATPTTGITNEPLMKIGSYSDSLTTSIPVTAGANTLSIGTTLQPSELTVNYKGWHPVTDVHERESGAWT